MLLFAEGFDDFSTNADLLMTSSADPTATTVTGRTGSGKAAQISGTGYINFGFPARAVIIAGFAFKGSSTLGLSSTEWLRIQFQAGGVTLFTIVQRSAAGLDFFDATANSIDFTTGWLGSASFSNFSSYIEVKLTPGYTGQVVVRIDGATVLNTGGNFSVPLSTTMLEGGGHALPYLYTGDTSLVVVSDAGMPSPPYVFHLGSLTSGTPLVCTSKSGTTWNFTPVIASGEAWGAGQIITTYAASASCDSIGFSALGSGYAVGAIDDLYVIDTTGAQNNTFLGDVRITSLPPTGDGADSGWTPNTGSTHYTQVNESPLDYDTSYVNATAAGQSDTYTFPAVPSINGTIAAVQIRDYAKSDSGGTDKLQGIARVAGTDYLAPAGDQFIHAVYTGLDSIFELNPATGLPWALAEVNAAQFGQKRTV